MEYVFSWLGVPGELTWRFAFVLLILGITLFAAMKLRAAGEPYSWRDVVADLLPVWLFGALLAGVALLGRMAVEWGGFAFSVAYIGLWALSRKHQSVLRALGNPRAESGRNHLRS